MPKIKFSFPFTWIVLVVLSSTNILVLAKGNLSPFINCPIPPELRNKLQTNSEAIQLASTDFGNIVHYSPAAVLCPSTVHDIQTLIQSSYNCSNPFVISIRGNGHSTEGQDLAPNGVVVDMQQFKKNKIGTGFSFSKDPLFADVGAELLWADVLNFSLNEGVLPVSWTDYLGLTVGGTLSNAGIGGYMFRVGPQINNVYELDVITGKGELKTCSASKNSELFYAVLGGLGQFGVITRARIVVEPAKERVRVLTLLYSDFESFTNDQARIIAVNGRNDPKAVGFMKGNVILNNGNKNIAQAISNFPASDAPKILSLIYEYGVIYSIQIADPYNNATYYQENKKLEILIKELNPIPGLVYQVDIPYIDHLERLQFISQVPTNWTFPLIDLFIPKSRIFDFNSGIVRDILLKQNITVVSPLFYPVNRNKWDNRMSVAIPDEDIFYQVSIFNRAPPEQLQLYLDQNDAIIKFCTKNGINFKEYLPHYTEKQQWIQHFGSKWVTIETRKKRFDPKSILSPGQKIFN